MDPGPAIAIAVGLGVIYGLMLAAIIFAWFNMGREEH